MTWCGVENLLSIAQFPAHVLSAEEEASGFEIERLVNGRRSATDYWAPTTANSQTWFKVDCQTPRGADYIVLDRGHNLDGVTIQVQTSDDDSTWADAFNGTIPSNSSPGSIDDQTGVVTEDGAWIKRFPLASGVYWRVLIPAMGAGVVPHVIGCWLGKSYTAREPDQPFDDDAHDLVTTETQSAVGWVAYGERIQRRAGNLSIRMMSLAEYDLARYHLAGHYGAGRPMWLAFDADAGHRAMCVVRPLATMAFVYATDWWNKRRGTVPYREHEPQRVT